MSLASPPQEWDGKEFQTWLTKLSSQLEVLGGGFLRRASDHAGEVEDLGIGGDVPDNRTSFAWITIVTVMNELRELPGMRDNPGLAILDELQCALNDLRQGGKPLLLQPRPGVGKGQEATRRTSVRRHALFFVSLLTKVGVNATEACSLVACKLADAGHIGRKREGATGIKGALSPKTVQGWLSASRQRSFATKHPAVAEFVTASMTAFVAEQGPVEDLTRADVELLIDAMINDAMLQTKA